MSENKIPLTGSQGYVNPLVKDFSEHTDKVCDIVNYNYYPGSIDGEYAERFIGRHVGYDSVVKIIEHTACGEGDKHYFDILYDNDRVERIFNPHQAFYSLINQSI
jgi:hypothetical protein